MPHDLAKFLSVYCGKLLNAQHSAALIVPVNVLYPAGHAVHAATPLSTHLEIETYTWDVLPDHLKTGDITEYVVRELEYVRDELGRQIAALPPE